MTRELRRFLIVGGLTVLVDYAFYRLLRDGVAIDTDAAKAVSFLVGTVFAFFANRTITFASDRSIGAAAPRFAALYTSTLLVNVSVNAATIWAIGDGSWGIRLAFLGATGVSAALNFVGMKFFVFPNAPVRRDP